MPSALRGIAITVICLGVFIVFAMLLHLGGSAARFSVLGAALIGGSLVLFASLRAPRPRESQEAWVGFEQLGWVLIGCGQIFWAVGESFFRYYTLTEQTAFPSFADLGYSFFPLLCFAGLLSQPFTETGRKRFLMLLDSLIAMGALFAISWYFLLGALTQSPMQSVLEKFLGLYYPITDTALLSCVVFLLIRGQSKLYQVTARKMSLLVAGLGLVFFASSDFIFNLQNAQGTYVDGTWVDLGWPLGMLLIGFAACLRSYLPAAHQDHVEERLQKNPRYMGFSPTQLLPYALIGVLFVVLILNVTSNDPEQGAIRLVLVLTTIGAIGLVIVRQILTLIENEHLAQLQARTLQQIEDQARQIAERNSELESGVSHLKAVQTSLANGNLRARAQLQGGVLWSLASSLNLLADRLGSLGQARRRLDRITHALLELSNAIERSKAGQAFIFPSSCHSLPEIAPVLHSMGLHQAAHLANAPEPSMTQENSPRTAPNSVPWPMAEERREQHYRMSPGAPHANKPQSSPLSQRNTKIPQTPPLGQGED
jgi:hypothetical protein